MKLPLTRTNNPALAYDSRAEGLLVYLKDVNFDRDGQPVILFLTSKGFEPGPANGPRQWQTLRWTGKEWVRRPFTTSGNNYDHGSLYIEPDGTWRVIAPTELGPQPYNPGGEMVMWTSPDEGQTWTKRQAAHPRQPAQPHLRPPSAQRASRISTRSGPTATGASRPNPASTSPTSAATTSGVCPARWRVTLPHPPSWGNRPVDL